MRRKKRSSLLASLLRPLIWAIIPLGLFGLIWLRSSVTSSAYKIHELEQKRVAAIKETKTLIAERSRLMAIANLSLPSDDNVKTEKMLVSGGYIFPDRLKVVHLKRAKATDVYKASYKKEKTD